MSNVSLRGSYPIYSREWHGISLVDVAREVGIPEQAVANRDLYAALYRRWAAASFTPDAGWLAAKRRAADAVREMVHASGGPPSRAISVGAGLAIVERHLIESGWPVEIQECQPESLAYAARFVSTRMWTEDFGGLPSGEYDLVLALSLVYVFDDEAYRTFARHCGRMLKPGGRLLVWDHDPKVPLSLAKRFFDRYVRGRHDLRWGWLRSPARHAEIIGAEGFDAVDVRFYDLAIARVPPPPRVAGFQWPGGRSVAQSLLFRKRDGGQAAREMR